MQLKKLKSNYVQFGKSKFGRQFMAFSVSYAIALVLFFFLTSCGHATLSEVKLWAIDDATSMVRKEAGQVIRRKTKDSVNYICISPDDFQKILIELEKPNER